MEASRLPSLQLPSPAQPPPKFEPDIEKIRQRLLRKGVFPTPKILRALRKKEIQKHNRKVKGRESEPPLSESQKQELAEESHFQTLKREYTRFTKAVGPRNSYGKSGGGGSLMVGKPWEGIERVRLKELASSSNEEFIGDKLRRENLKELREMLEQDLRWVLEDDVELEGLDGLGSENQQWNPVKRWRSESEAIRFLVDRLSHREITERHWKFVRMMKQSGLQFTENQLLKIVEGLGNRGSWRQALALVQWVYADKERRHFKSRFVYTKLLSVLGNARRPHEALRIFNLMLGDRHIYPDIAAYHSIAVTLGQAGLLKELLKIIESMRQKPSKRIKHVRYKNWDPVLEPDLVVYNAVLNACVPLHQWKGVSWVFKQLRKSGLKPNAATYGLAMEVMLESGKYDFVHEFFRKMKRSGEAPKALTYKVLVRAFWKEGKINEAVEAVRDMEQRGVIGTASVYYELACCLCNCGRWRDAVVEVEKMKKLQRSKPLEVTFTGLIMSSMDGGHVDDCMAIFQYMKDHCMPNVGTLNTMVKVYGQNDMFSEAKKLFEEMKKVKSGLATSVDDGGISLIPDEYTYSSMLEASARALQWEYFEYVYKEMILSGYQLDQTKHAFLLVEAARAGKRYILEHAFDLLLEAGEIPHPLFFTEMLCQAIAEDNYERAIMLINTMALAPFQVSERQWTDLFEKNEGRIRQEHLGKLLDALSDCDVASETTVINLSRSLSSLCGFVPSRNFSGPVYFGAEAMDTSLSDQNDRVFNGTKRVSLPSSPSMIGVNSNTSEDLPVSETDVAFSVFSVGNSNTNKNDEVEADILSRLSNHDYTKNGVTELFNKNEGFVIKEESDECADLLNDELSTLDLNALELPVTDFGESDGCDLPTAHEILEQWKESRKKDGILFPFQLGKK